MSVSNIFPSSNHSLYTPSYSADAFMPLNRQDLTSMSLADVSPSSLELPPLVSLPTEAPIRIPKSKNSQTLISSPVSRASPDPKVEARPLQYQKLKMNYLRRLNVIPIISQKDVLAVIGEKEGTSYTDVSSREVLQVRKTRRSSKQISRELSRKGSPSDGDSYSQGFVPSFLPSASRASQPIPIPQRSKKPSRNNLADEDFEKGDIASSCRKPASLAADHFGVFFPDFEL